MVPSRNRGREGENEYGLSTAAREKEREIREERKGARENEREGYMCIYRHQQTYIYIYRERARETALDRGIVRQQA